MIVFHSAAIVSIDLILFSFESVAKALYFMSEIFWKMWRIIVKKGRWKKSTFEPRHLWVSFSHIRYLYLSRLQICNCFSISNVISSEINAVLGTFDGFSMFTFKYNLIQNQGVYHCSNLERAKIEVIIISSFTSCAFFVHGYHQCKALFIMDYKTVRRFPNP